MIRMRLEDREECFVQRPSARIWEGFRFLVKIPQNLIDHSADMGYIRQGNASNHDEPMEMYQCCLVWRAWIQDELNTLPVRCTTLGIPSECVCSYKARHFLGHAPKSSVSKRFAFTCIPINCGCCCCLTGNSIHGS